MRIVGHGIDLVDIARIERLLAEHPDRFPSRCFTASELAHAGVGRSRAQHLAGRFAAKEAVLKALGTGLSGGIEWTEVEIAPADSGAPVVRLHGRAGEVASSLGVREWLVSISHSASHAMASAIAVGDRASAPPAV